ncbi:hypothetical protein RCH23_002122 [Cryobacterium sp. CAN_C3]|uniref:hypothetical protein n=1 Tax=unclassified Cryobacterium TaxID=2649013 RepID=UPI0018C9568C|nr:hypothetical protein [Cryobacterium sp. CAN_C3]MEC5154737.1 hypothetical protein [Cryobacterium sp. CAN_C3]
MDWTREWFERQRFDGWKTFGELTRDDLPKTCGVYVVLTELTNAAPEVLSESVGGFHKHKPLTDDPAKVAANWQHAAEVLYIGMAGSEKGFHDRLWAYSQQGRGFRAGHRGGRYVWQLPKSEQLTVAWRATGNLDAHDVEDALLAIYIERWGDRPFANLRDGHRFTPNEARELLDGWLITR